MTRKVPCGGQASNFRMGGRMLGYGVAGERVQGTPEAIGDIIVGQVLRVVLYAIAGRAETVCVSEY
jgi:hypothetical protein